MEEMTDPMMDRLLVTTVDTIASQGQTTAKMDT
jgi:hypothetical protein